MITYEDGPIDGYLALQESMGGVFATPADAGRWKFFLKPGSNRAATELRDLNNETRLYWISTDRQAMSQVARALGLADQAQIILFLPEAIENQLVDLERAYMNLEEDEIESTRFRCVAAGGS